MLTNEGDGLRHFAYQKEQVFYNGITLDEIHESNHQHNVNGIHGTSSPPELAGLPS